MRDLLVRPTKVLDWAIVFFVLLALGSVVRADEFDDVRAKYNAAKAAPKAKCACGGDPILCDCGPCTCAGGGSCRVAKKTPKAPAMQAPVATFKHDCGCPSAACNCGSGDCHCSENRVDNRQPSRWVRDEGYWYLYRGTQCLGAMKINGTQYFQWLGTDFSTVPMKPPSVPPYRSQEQSKAPQQQPVCRT